MNNGKPIRLPAYMVSLLSKWKRVTTVLTERLGRPPTPDEIGRALRLSKKKVGIVAKAIRVNTMIAHQDGSVGDDEGIALDSILTDDRSKTPCEQMIEADDLERILERLGDLDDREATVIRMRFGLEPYGPMTLREIGENLNLTRERVRQLENQSILKLTLALTGGEEVEGFDSLLEQTPPKRNVPSMRKPSKNWPERDPVQSLSKAADFRF